MRVNYVNKTDFFLLIFRGLEMHVLPNDLVLYIFYFVDCPEILRLVCKDWKKLIHLNNKNPLRKHLRSGLISVLSHGYIQLYKLFPCKVGNLERYAHTDFLKLWKQEGTLKLTVEIFANVTSFGNLENMKWLKENGCPWDTWTFSQAEKRVI